MKNYTFKTINKFNDTNTYTTTGSYTSTDYSKVLDDLISTNLINNNKYLIDSIFSSSPTTSKSSTIFFTDSSDKFKKAASFLANYKKNDSKKLPFIIGKTYYLADGTPIIFYSDEIQIGFDLYGYDYFLDKSFLNSLSPKTKKTIIEIYTNGTKISISL